MLFSKRLTGYFLCNISLFIILFLCAPLNTLFAQTCSCAGAPLISTQSFSSTSEGNLLIGLTHEYNDISNIYRGSKKIENPSVQRYTQSSLLEINYGITNRLTISATTSFVQKFRKSGLQNAESIETLKTRGIGDGLVILKYVLHQNTIQEQYQIALGGGAKIPLGKSNLTQEGLLLNADMQPGTGAWDGIGWSYFSKTFAPATTINLFWYNLFRLTGKDERFSPNDNYEFGNELISTLGAKNNFGESFSYILMAQYRSTASDQLNGAKLSTTGGKWIFLQPAIGYNLTDQLSLRLSTQIPIYQHMNGLQPSTSFTLSGSIFYNFGSRVIF